MPQPPALISADRLGAHQPPAERLTLTAGPLECVFEPESAFLRYVRLGDVEILRGVYAAVRDHNWDTIAPTVTDLRLERDDAGFRVRFHVDHREHDVDFGWDGELRGGADGTLRFGLSGRARSDFRRNRIGFCVLHPAHLAGRPCTVETVDGSRGTGTFPETISPHQPFQDLRAIAHEVVPGVTAEVRFEGDVFEMEDQRNWTDASYKTYCTPLGLPFPVAVPTGTVIEQRVTLSVRGAAEAAAPRAATPIVLAVTESASAPRVPRLGLGVASHGQALGERERDRLRRLGLAHLRVDLDLYRPTWPQALDRAAAEARALGAELEIALILGDAPERELDALIDAARGLGAHVARWLVFHRSEKSTSAQWLRAARARFNDAVPPAPVFGGTNAYFAELNRGRPPRDALDGIAYSINPQVHAADDASLVETLAAQRDTVASARTFAAGLPLAITPITLKPRFNPNATGPEPEPGPGELPREVDARQATLFGAGWTLGSLKHLSEAAVESLTYFETSGWRGVMETDTGAPLPTAFASAPGGVYPLYHVLADVGELAAGRVLASVASDPLRVEILALAHEDRTRVMVANLGPEAQHVRLTCPRLPALVRVKTLDGETVAEAMREPERFRADPGLHREVRAGRLELCLSPYAIVRIDAVEGTLA
jgi:D-apionolactonase